MNIENYPRVKKLMERREKLLAYISDPVDSVTAGASVPREVLNRVKHSGLVRGLFIFAASTEIELVDAQLRQLGVIFSGGAMNATDGDQIR